MTDEVADLPALEDDEELGYLLKHGSARRRRVAASLMGQRGGPARAAALTPERRTEIARAAARARWSRAK